MATEAGSWAAAWPDRPGGAGPLRGSVRPRPWCNFGGRRATPLPLDREIYKWRHLIENFFCKLRRFKRIAMRADKTDHRFKAMIHLAAAIINSR